MNMKQIYHLLFIIACILYTNVPCISVVYSLAPPGMDELNPYDIISADIDTVEHVLQKFNPNFKTSGGYNIISGEYDPDKFFVYDYDDLDYNVKYTPCTPMPILSSFIRHSRLSPLGQFSMLCSDFVFTGQQFFSRISGKTYGLYEDQENVYLYVRGYGSMKSILKQMKSDDLEGIEIKLMKQQFEINVRKIGFIEKEIRLVIPKSFLSFHSNTEKTILRRLRNLALVFRKKRADFKLLAHDRERFSEILRHLERGLTSRNKEYFFSALNSVHSLPRVIAKYIVDTLIQYGHEISIDSKGFIDMKQCDAFPHYYQKKYFDFVLPIRTELCNIIGKHNLSENADMLLSFLDSTSCADIADQDKLYISTERPEFRQLRLAAAKALGSIAEHDDAVLQKILTRASKKTTLPWWIKQSALFALGFCNNTSPAVIGVLNDALMLENNYLKSVLLNRKTDTITNKFKGEELISAYALLSLGRLKQYDVILRFIKTVDKKHFIPVVNCLIESMGYSKSENFIPFLLEIARHNILLANTRVKALQAAKKINKSNALLHATLVDLWNHTPVKDLDAPKYEAEDGDPYPLLTWVTETLAYAAQKKSQKDFGYSIIENEIVSQFIDLEYSEFINLAVETLSKESLRPETKITKYTRPDWELAAVGIKKKLELNPHDHQAIKVLKELFDLMNEYWSTSYILKYQLDVYGEIISNLDQKYWDFVRDKVLSLIPYNTVGMSQSPFAPHVAKIALQHFIENYVKTLPPYFSVVALHVQNLPNIALPIANKVCISSDSDLILQAQ